MKPTLYYRRRTFKNVKTTVRDSYSIFTVEGKKIDSFLTLRNARRIYPGYQFVKRPDTSKIKSFKFTPAIKKPVAAKLDIAKAATQNLTSGRFKNICIAAIDAALVTVGDRKGMLLANCPKANTDGAAAWQAIMGYANPYKMSIAKIMFFNDRQSAIYKAIDDSLKNTDVRHLDKDRVALELLGAW